MSAEVGGGCSRGTGPLGLQDRAALAQGTGVHCHKLPLPQLPTSTGGSEVITVPCM